MSEATCIDFFVSVDDYCPNNTLRYVKLCAGDTFTISNRQGENFKPGQKYLGFDNLMVYRIIYAPKKWWQFWKRRKVIGYIVMCIKD